MKEELDVDAELDRMDNNNGDENPYRDLVDINANRVELSHSPIKQWSILGNVINYAQHSRNPFNFHFMMVKPVKFSKIVKAKDRSEILPSINLIESPSRSRAEYLDRYEGI